MSTEKTSLENETTPSCLGAVMHQLSPDLKRNDLVKYTGGSDSKYLTLGNEYRLIRTPEIRHKKVVIKNDAGKRMITHKRYFKGA